MYRKIHTQHTFDRCLAFVARQDLMLIVVLTSLAGLSVFFSGIVAEIVGDSQRLAQGGRQAMDLYLMGLQVNPIDNIPEYLRLGIMGRLPSDGGNQQAIGIVVIFVGSALAALTVMMARLYLAFSARAVYRVAERIQ